MHTKHTGEVKSGGTKADRNLEWEVVENKQALVPAAKAAGFSLATRKRRTGRKGAKGRKGRKRTKAGVVSRLPPALMTTDNVPFRRRYAVSASVGPVSVTRANICGALGGVCTIVNSTILAWASSFHIRRIIVWPAVASGAQTACEIYWSVGGGAEQQLSKDSATITNVPSGITQDSAIVMVPPRKSYLSEWQQSGVDSSDVMFVIQNLTQGTIVDFEGVYTLANAAGGVNITGITTASQGSVYYLALDGRASNKLVPQGLPTTS